MVIFESRPNPGCEALYLDATERLFPLLAEEFGFVSVERFQSLTDPGKLLTLSYWQNEEAVERWRNVAEHRRVQEAGRSMIFSDYYLTVARIIRAYGLRDRDQAPPDSRIAHG